MSDSPLRSLLAPARYLSRAEMEDLTRRVLGFSTADETRVTINSGTRGNTRFAVNQISTAGDSYNTTITVRSAFGRKAANSTTNKADDESLRAVVGVAERLARLAPDDPEAMPELGPQSYETVPPLHGWSDATASLEPDARANAVREISMPARADDLRSTGYLETQAGAFGVATSRGLFAYGRQTGAALTSTVRTPDGTGSGWAGASHFDWSAIDAGRIGARAIDKASRSRDPVAVEPGRYTVVLEPTAVGNLVQLLAFSLNARAADEGRSFFTKPGGGNKIGLQVVDERVSIVSDPLDPVAPALPFSGDGFPASRTLWLENGIVRNLAYDRYWAQKMSRTPTPLIGTIRMSGGDSSVDEMVGSTERGILVTRFWYIRSVDPRTILYTGLTRDGTFLIENGRVTGPVKNMRFNESPVFMLNNLEAMGQPVRVSASEDGSPGFAVVVPAIKVRDFNFTSLSDAI
ncbi:MAG: TldD/PmbA family protein [Gemmatimonadaceae bacterium]